MRTYFRLVFSLWRQAYFRLSLGSAFFGCGRNQVTAENISERLFWRPNFQTNHNWDHKSSELFLIYRCSNDQLYPRTTPFYLGGLVRALNRANSESRDAARNLVEVSYQATLRPTSRFREARCIRFAGYFSFVFAISKVFPQKSLFDLFSQK